jgi:hypothetical protein
MYLLYNFDRIGGKISRVEFIRIALICK